VERLGDGLFIVFATGMAEFGQIVRRPFTVDDSPDDLETSFAGDVTHDRGQFEVHKLQSLLHMLDVLSAVLEQSCSLAAKGSELTDVGLRSEGGLQQTIGVELLKPLAIKNIGFTTGNRFEVTGVD